MARTTLNHKKRLQEQESEPKLSLIGGPPYAGKTVLLLHLLREALYRGENAVVILSDDPEAFLYAAERNLDLDLTQPLDSGQLRIFQFGDDTEALFHLNPNYNFNYAVRQFTEELSALVKYCKADFLAFDSIDPIFANSKPTFAKSAVRHFIRALRKLPVKCFMTVLGGLEDPGISLELQELSFNCDLLMSLKRKGSMRTIAMSSSPLDLPDSPRHQVLFTPSGELVFEELINTETVYQVGGSVEMVGSGGDDKHPGQHQHQHQQHDYAYVPTSIPESASELAPAPAQNSVPSPAVSHAPQPSPAPPTPQASSSPYRPQLNEMAPVAAPALVPTPAPQQTHYNQPQPQSQRQPQDNQRRAPQQSSPAPSPMPMPQAPPPRPILAQPPTFTSASASASTSRSRSMPVHRGAPFQAPEDESALPPILNQWLKGAIKKTLLLALIFASSVHVTSCFPIWDSLDDDQANAMISTSDEVGEWDENPATPIIHEERSSSDYYLENPHPLAAWNDGQMLQAEAEIDTSDDYPLYPTSRRGGIFPWVVPDNANMRETAASQTMGTRRIVVGPRSSAGQKPGVATTAGARTRNPKGQRADYGKCNMDNAYLMMQDEQRDDALNCYRTLLTSRKGDEPDYRNVLFALVAVLWASGDEKSNREALSHLDTHLRRYPHDREALLRRARLYTSLPDKQGYESAISDYREFLRLHDGAPNSTESEDQEQPQSSTQSQQKSHAQNRLITLIAAPSQTRARAQVQAIPNYYAAPYKLAAMEPQSPPPTKKKVNTTQRTKALLELAAVLSWSGTPEAIAEAESIYTSQLSAEPGNYQLLLLRGRVRSWAGNYHGAIGDYKAYLLRNDDRTVRQELAIALTGIGDFQAAEAQYARLDQEIPLTGQVLLQRGQAHMWAGNYDAAEAIFLKVKMENKETELELADQAELELANMESYRGNQLKALQLLDQLLARRPHMEEAVKQQEKIRAGWRSNLTPYMNLFADKTSSFREVTGIGGEMVLSPKLSLLVDVASYRLDKGDYSGSSRHLDLGAEYRPADWITLQLTGGPRFSGTNGVNGGGRAAANMALSPNWSLDAAATVDEFSDWMNYPDAVREGVRGVDLTGSVGGSAGPVETWAQAGMKLLDDDNRAVEVMGSATVPVIWMLSAGYSGHYLGWTNDSALYWSPQSYVSHQAIVQIDGSGRGSGNSAGNDGNDGSGKSDSGGDGGKAGSDKESEGGLGSGLQWHAQAGVGTSSERTGTGRETGWDLAWSGGAGISLPLGNSASLGGNAMVGASEREDNRYWWTTGSLLFKWYY